MKFTYNTALHCTAPHRTAPHSTAQHSTAQHTQLAISNTNTARTASNTMNAYIFSTPDKVGQFCHLSARYGITSGEVGTYSTNFSFAIT